MMQKRKKLEELLNVYAKEDIILAFSGGVDSTVLLKAACEKAKKHHRNVYAYTIHTVLHPMEELELTERMAREMGAIHRVVQVDELREAGIEDNPENRCYLCKKCMFTKVKHEAERLGITTILDGTNEDDTKEYRTWHKKPAPDCRVFKGRSEGIGGRLPFGSVKSSGCSVYGDKVSVWHDAEQ